MIAKFVIEFNILAADKFADILAFSLDFPGHESVAVW